MAGGALHSYAPFPPLHPFCDFIEAEMGLTKHLACLPWAFHSPIGERQPAGERPSSLIKHPSSALSHLLPIFGSTFLRMFRAIIIDSHQRV